MNKLERVQYAAAWYNPKDPGEPGADGQGGQRVSITDEEAKIISLLCVGADVLEIGTGVGVSAANISKTARSVTTIDIDPWVHEAVWPSLPRNVKTCKDIKKLKNEKFDICFLDGDHTKEQVIIDMKNVYDMVDDLIILHDFRLVGVIEALKELGLKFAEVRTEFKLALVFKSEQASGMQQVYKKFTFRG